MFSEREVGNPAALPYDPIRLAHAVAYAETGKNCSLGSGRTHLNCFGIYGFNKKGRYLVRFKTKEASYDHFNELWARKYKKFPTMKEAKQWTGGDRVQNWLYIVNHYYQNPT